MFKPALSLSIAVACALTAISLPKYFSQHQHQMYALVGLLLPALFDFSTRHRWDKWFGDLSYPLYLVHWPICVFGLAMLGEGGTGALHAYAAVVVSIGLSIAINHFLVYPVDQWRQHRARRMAGILPDAQRRQDASVPA